MKYPDGQEVRLGDRIGLGDDREGVVVCSIDTDEYSDAHTREQWAYLKKGVVIEFTSFGLIHYETAEDDLELIRRA